MKSRKMSKRWFWRSTYLGWTTRAQKFGWNRKTMVLFASKLFHGTLPTFSLRVTKESFSVTLIFIYCVSVSVKSTMESWKSLFPKRLELDSSSFVNDFRVFLLFLFFVFKMVLDLSFLMKFLGFFVFILALCYLCLKN